MKILIVWYFRMQLINIFASPIFDEITDEDLIKYNKSELYKKINSKEQLFQIV